MRSCKYFSGVIFTFMDLYVTVVKTFHMNLNNAIYFIQRLENTGMKRIEFLIDKSWRTIKLIGKNYQSGPRAMSCYDLLIWTDSPAFLLCYVTEENCHASRQTNVPCSRLSHSRDYA